MRSVTLVRMTACSQRACIYSFGLGMVEQGLTRSALNVIFARPKKLCALKYDVAVLLLFRSPLEQPTFELMLGFWSSDYGVSEALCASARIPKCMALHAASGQSPSGVSGAPRASVRILDALPVSRQVWSVPLCSRTCVHHLRMCFRSATKIHTSDVPEPRGDETG